MKKLTKDVFWDYFILTARVLLAWTFLSYGYSKLAEGQFGVTEAEMATALKDLSLFRISWYVFDQEPFKSIVGISQIICGSLLLVNRTTLLGAFIFLPLVATILIIDLTVMPPFLAQGFAWRLSFYILLDFLILWHYKEKMRVIWDTLWNKVNTRYRFPIWSYLLLPLFAIGLEFAGALPKLLIQIIIDPQGIYITAFQCLNLATEMMNQIAG